MRIQVCSAAIAIVFAASAAAHAGTFKTIYSLTGRQNVEQGVEAGKDGSVYGVTTFGGKREYGLIYRLSPTSTGEWTYSKLYEFRNKKDGAYPIGPVRFGPDGKLYGAAASYGSGGGGTIYRLSPDKSGGGWTFEILHSLVTGKDGYSPQVGLTFDKRGDAYGVAATGGKFGCGTAFRLVRRKTFEVLHQFSCDTDGQEPSSRVAFDAAGNLFGTTAYGGPKHGGIIYRLDASKKWKRSTVYAFEQFAQGAEEATEGGVYFDTEGNRLIATDRYWLQYLQSAVVELKPGAKPNQLWTSKALISFPKTDRTTINSGFLSGSGDSLYAIGNNYGPKIFKLTFSEARDALSAEAVYSDADGEFPTANLAKGSDGCLYGATHDGGSLGAGSVFQYCP